jgi:type IV secretion system protein VirD4
MKLSIPSMPVVVVSFIAAVMAFLLVLNLWIVIAFRQPADSITLWLWFAPPDAWNLINPEAFTTALKLAAGAGSAVLIGCLAMAAQQPEGTPYGDARWATRREIKKAGLLDRYGVIVGKLGGPRGFAPFIQSARDHFCNTLLVAPPGGGKGVGVVIPTLLTWPGSTVVLDVKGENFDKTAKQRAAMGDAIFLFSPLSEDGRTHRFNPLEVVAGMDNPNRQLTELRRIASHLVVSTGKADENFIEGARELFVGTASAIMGQDNPTIGAILDALTPAMSDGQIPPKAPGMAARLQVLAGQCSHPKARNSLLQYAAYDPKTLAVYLSVLKTSGLGAWSDPAVDAATSGNDFDLTSLRSAPQSIYIVIAPNDMKILAPVARLFFQTVVAAMQAHLPTEEETLPVLLLLDEFKSLGKMEAVSEATGTLRQYGGRMLLVVQGIPNLEEVYGRAGADSLMNACQLHAFMSINDPRSKEMLSRSLGTHGVETTSTSMSRMLGAFGGSRSESTQTRAQKLLDEAEINRLGPDTILLVPKDARPIKARKVIYHRDRALRKLTSTRAPARLLPGAKANAVTVNPEPKDRLADKLVQSAQALYTEIILAKESEQPAIV